MKTIIRQSIIAAVLLISTAGAQARGTSLHYSRNANERIGITAGNQVAVGGWYKITDPTGKIILRGRIKSAKTFYIPLNQLSNGQYRFSVDGYELQSFTIED